MEFLTGIGGWIAVVVAAVGAILAWVAKAKRDGKAEADAKYAKETAEANVAATNAEAGIVKETGDVKTDVNALPIGDSVRELRSNWNRPDQNN